MQSEDGIVLREFLIRVLIENGVTVTPHQGSTTGHLVLGKGDVLDVRQIPEEVHRRMVHALARKFDIAKHLFYN